MNKEGKFILLNRDEFKKWLFENNFKRPIQLIQNHHTYIPNYSHFNGKNHFEKVEGMERTHVEREFGEIAQNITTFKDGVICICRDFNKQPCGIYGANKFALCIENLGNFNLGGDIMAEEQKKSIIFINAALCVKFNIKPDTNSIIYHHWYDLKTGKRTNGTGTTKSCPGTNFFGGNTVDAATKNFIPLVAEVYNSLKSNNNTKEEIIPQGKVIVDINDVLNVRTGPGPAYKFVRALKNGDGINIYAEKDGWLKISGNEEWVNGKFVQRL